MIVVAESAKDMTREEIEANWRDPHNRKWGVYFSKADPRVIVPRHRKWMGWTLNFARPSAIPVLFCIFVLLVVPVAMVRANGGGTVASFFAVTAGVLIASLLSAYLASTKRWGH